MSRSIHYDTGVIQKK